jgi:hypothetical protein
MFKKIHSLQSVMSEPVSYKKLAGPKGLWNQKILELILIHYIVYSDTESLKGFKVSENTPY